MRGLLVPLLTYSLLPLSLQGQTVLGTLDTTGFAAYERQLYAATRAYATRTAQDPWIFPLDTLTPPAALAPLHDSVLVAANALLVSERRWSQYIGRIPGSCSDGRLAMGCGDPARAFSTDGTLLRFQYATARDRFVRVLAVLRNRIRAGLAARA
jgi:hypothetical protein